MNRRALEAFQGKKQRPDLASPHRKCCSKVATSVGIPLRPPAGRALAIREVARRVGRDVKAVHGDVHALIDAGLLDRTAKKHVVFPFEAIRVEFTLRAA